MNNKVNIFFLFGSFLIGTAFSQSVPPVRGVVFDNPDLNGYGILVEPPEGSNAQGASGSVINFDFGTGDIGSQTENFGFVDGDSFSVRWNGVVVGKSRENHTIRVVSDDGVRIHIEGRTVIDDWDGIGLRENVGNYFFEAGREYTVTVEYRENTGAAKIQVYWSSSTLAEELIPFNGFESGNYPDLSQTLNGVGGTSTYTDPDDVVNSSQNTIDIEEISIQAYPDYYSFIYKMDLIEDADAADPKQGYNLFIDIDENSDSGYPVYSIGAEYLIQGNRIFLYVGNGTEWNWSPLEPPAPLWFERGRTATHTYMQMLVRRQWFSYSSADFRMVFFGDNAAERGGDTVEIVPNNAAQGGFMEFGPPPQTGFIFDGIIEWRDYASRFPRDPIDQPTNNPIDIRQLFLTNDASQITIGYWNQHTINWNNGYLLFVDTHRNLNTGYPVYGRKAEFLIRDQRVFRYTGGASGSWSWEFIGEAENLRQFNQAELRFPRSWFGNQTANTLFDFKFYGDNAAAGGTGADPYPDGGSWLGFRLQ